MEPPQNTFMMGVGRQWGDAVRFSCQEGFRMFGEPEIQCLASGEWNRAPPSCHSEFQSDGAQKKMRARHLVNVFQIVGCGVLVQRAAP